jgi:magnesium transporter
MTTCSPNRHAVGRYLRLDDTAAIARALAHAHQVALAGHRERQEMARIRGQMAHDARADLVANLTEGQRNALLPALARAGRDDRLKLSGQTEGTGRLICFAKATSLLGAGT